MNTNKQEKEADSLLRASRTGEGARDTESNSTNSDENRTSREPERQSERENLEPGGQAR